MGIRQVHDVACALNNAGVHVNKSAGFHVHVNAQGLDNDAIKHIAQAFVKYEEVFDCILPASRRDNSYCKSNSALLHGRPLDKHYQIECRSSLRGVVELVSPDRYMKMNLQNLLSEGKTTIE